MCKERRKSCVGIWGLTKITKSEFLLERKEDGSIELIILWKMIFILHEIKWCGTRMSQAFITGKYLASYANQRLPMVTSLRLTPPLGEMFDSLSCENVWSIWNALTCVLCWSHGEGSQSFLLHLTSWVTGYKTQICLNVNVLFMIHFGHHLNKNWSPISTLPRRVRSVFFLIKIKHSGYELDE